MPGMNIGPSMGRAPEKGTVASMPPTIVNGPGRLRNIRIYANEMPFTSNLERGEEIVTSAPQLYIDVDVEADGKPGYGSLLSVGAVAGRYVLNEETGLWDLEQEKFYKELKPSSEEFVPSQRDFCEKHGLKRERLLDEGVDPAEAMEELAEWEKQTKYKFGKDKSALVAFNASFDYPWVDLEMVKAEVPNPFGIAGYCIKSLAQILAPGYDWSNTSKQKLPDDVIPSGGFTHNALPDAVYQQGMHFAMVGKIDRLMGSSSHWSSE